MLCLFIMAFAVTAEADDTFSARGQVTDANGNPVPGADVTMVNMAYKAVASTKTDVNGNFTFNDVNKGGNVVKVVASYTDTNGRTYSMPPEFGMWFPANGTVNINKNATQILDYPPTVQPIDLSSMKPSAQIPLNVSALAIALVLGIVILAGAYWLLRIKL
jgi:hypothetical protein